MSIKGFERQQINFSKVIPIQLAFNAFDLSSLNTSTTFAVGDLVTAWLYRLKNSVYGYSLVLFVELAYKLCLLSFACFTF